MVEVELDTEFGIAILRPMGVLSKNDFAATACTIDPYIEKYGKLAGLIVHTKTFPGWEHFGALMGHMKFIKNHHKQISHVAIVTDSVIGDLAEKIASHFVTAEIRHFSFNNIEGARTWILTAEQV